MNFLLRLRVMPGMYGEEATLQVLQTAAVNDNRDILLHCNGTPWACRLPNIVAGLSYFFGRA